MKKSQLNNIIKEVLQNYKLIKEEESLEDFIMKKSQGNVKTLKFKNWDEVENEIENLRGGKTKFDQEEKDWEIGIYGDEGYDKFEEIYNINPLELKSYFKSHNLNESKSCSCNNSSSLLNESLKHTYPISEQFRALIDAKKPLISEIKNSGNVKLIREARILFDKGMLNLPPKCKTFMETTDFGKYKIVNSKLILITEQETSNNIKWANVASQSFINLLEKHVPIKALYIWKNSLKYGFYDKKIKESDIENIVKFAWDKKGKVNNNTLKQDVRKYILDILEKEN